MTLDALLLTLIGAILGPIISSVWTWLSLKSSQIALTGDWLSAWETRRENGTEWINVKVKIYVGFNGYKLKSFDSDKYRYEGDFRVVNNKYLLGQWKSSRPHDEASGVFLLTKSLDGKCFYGLITVPNQENLIDGKNFIIGRIQKGSKPELTDVAVKDAITYIDRGQKLLKKFLAGNS